MALVTSDIARQTSCVALDTATCRKLAVSTTATCAPRHRSGWLGTRELTWLARRTAIALLRHSPPCC